FMLFRPPPTHTPLPYTTLFRSADVPTVEHTLADAPADQAEFLLRDVLPRLSPAYDALHKLTSTDVIVRRRGAQDLGRSGAAASLDRKSRRLNSSHQIISYADFC